MFGTIGAQVLERIPSPLWQVEARVISVWQRGEGADCHLLVATEEALVRCDLDPPHSLVLLFKFSLKVLATHVSSDRLTTLQQQHSCDDSTLKIETLNLATLTTSSVASMPLFSPAPTWLLVTSRNSLGPDIRKLLSRSTDDAVYCYGGHGSPTMAFTASDQGVQIDMSLQSKCQFIQKYVKKQQTDTNVTSFIELAAALAPRRFHNTDDREISVHRGLWDAIELEGKTFFLTYCGDLWEGDVRLLKNVTGLENVGGVLIARTLDGAIYRFSPGISRNSSSILEGLPRFKKKESIIKEVASAALELTRIGEDEERRREETDQMRLATLMLENKLVLEQKVEVSFGWGQGRSLHVELVNISGHELKGVQWRLHLEVRTREGKTWTLNVPVPSRLLPLSRFSHHLPLPKLEPGETPLNVATKLIYTGSSASCMLPTSVLANTQISLLKLLHIDSDSQSTIPSARNCSDDSLFSCLGIQPAPPASFHREFDRALLERSPLQVLHEISKTEGRKDLVLDFYGTKLSLRATSPSQSVCQVFVSGESVLVNSLLKELNATFPPATE